MTRHDVQKMRHGVISRHVAPEILSALTRRLALPILYAATTITIVRKASQKLRLAQIKIGIYTTGTGISVVVKNSRDSMLTIEFWLGAPVQISPETILTRPWIL